MRVAIVEDELHTRREIKRLLERYAAENSVSFHITEFADGDSITENYSGCYDLILMDVEMPFVDGMTASEEIRRVDQEVTIIFITNAPQYAIKGYKVGALDYILKPVSYYAFSESVKRAIMKIRARHPDDNYITISVKGGARKIGVSKGHLGHVETGSKNPSAEMLINTAAALEVPVDKLLSDLAIPYQTKDELQGLLNGCTNAEHRIITELAAFMKDLLKRYDI